MTYVSDHPLSVDGVRLDTLAWGIQASELKVGGLRAADDVLAGLDGEAASLNDAREPSTLTLSMFVRGTDEDGTVPADQDAQSQLRENLDTLLHLFAQSGRLIEVRETVGASLVSADVEPDLDAAERSFYAKVADSIAPATEVGAVARFTVALRNPGCYWRDPAPADWTRTAPTTGTVYDVDTLTGSSAPVDDAVLLLAGPTTGPATITDPATGAFVRLNEPVPAGSAWRVNVDTWETRVGPGLTLDSPDTAGTNRDAVTDQGGGYPRFLRLNPRRTGGARRVQISVTAAGMTAATALSIRARRAYL